MNRTLWDVYQRLFETLGPQQWWPAKTPFEVMVGAILVQNTSWRNAVRGIESLEQEGPLDARLLYRLPEEELAELLRPAGYYRIKARRLRNLLRLVMEQYESDVDTFLAEDPTVLREKLLGVNGVGPETADSIMLYAAGHPTFVVDKYTHRILARHGWIGYEADYYEMKELFESSLPADAKLFNEYHALLVRVGNEFCRTQPKCENCPLREMLPDGRIVEPF